VLSRSAVEALPTASGEIPCTRIGKVLRIDLSKVRVLDEEAVEQMAQRAMAR